MLVSPLCAPFLYIFMANGKVLWDMPQVGLYWKDENSRYIELGSLVRSHTTISSSLSHIFNLTTICFDSII